MTHWLYVSPAPQWEKTWSQPPHRQVQMEWLRLVLKVEEWCIEHLGEGFRQDGLILHGWLAFRVKAPLDILMLLKITFSDQFTMSLDEPVDGAA